jgi:hypothetical protein
MKKLLVLIFVAALFGCIKPVETSYCWSFNVLTKVYSGDNELSSTAEIIEKCSLTEEQAETFRLELDKDKGRKFNCVR